MDRLEVVDLEWVVRHHRVEIPCRLVTRGELLVNLTGRLVGRCLIETLVHLYCYLTTRWAITWNA